MRQIKDLKQGDKIYQLGFDQVKWYTYLCVHPRNSHYHILINQNEDPVRIYEPQLQSILNQGLNSHDDASVALADKMEQSAKDIRMRISMKGK